MQLARAAAQSPAIEHCAGVGTPEAAPASPVAGGPKVVASTSWAAAFARAAGATDVQTIAPANVQHPPDYDPRPSDLVAINDADFVLYAGFEGFADRMRAAVGAAPDRLVTVTLENSPEVIHTEVARLGALFGTEAAATAFLDQFDAEYACLSNEVRQAVGDGTPIVVAQVWTTPWAAMAGLDVAGTYGPAPISPSDLATLVALDPDYVFENANLPGGDSLLAATNATLVNLINFPAADESLLGIFRSNADTLISTFAP